MMVDERMTFDGDPALTLGGTLEHMLTRHLEIIAAEHEKASTDSHQLFNTQSTPYTLNCYKLSRQYAANAVDKESV